MTSKKNLNFALSGGGRRPLSLFLSVSSAMTSVKGTIGEAIPAGALGRFTGVNVPLRRVIVVAVQENSDGFSGWQAEAGRDGRIACSSMQVDNW